MSHRHPCLDAFHRGAADRQLRPLPSGRYKLQEFIFNRERELEELKRLTRYLQGYEKATSFLHCTSEDMAQWMRSLPEEAAYRVGYEFIPALPALAHDGARLPSINAAESFVKTRVRRAIQELDTAQSLLRGPIRIEYEYMKAGHSSIALPLREITYLASTALSIAS